VLGRYVWLPVSSALRWSKERRRLGLARADVLIAYDREFRVNDVDRDWEGSDRFLAIELTIENRFSDRIRQVASGFTWKGGGEEVAEPIAAILDPGKTLVAETAIWVDADWDPKEFEDADDWGEPQWPNYRVDYFWVRFLDLDGKPWEVRLDPRTRDRTVRKRHN